MIRKKGIAVILCGILATAMLTACGGDEVSSSFGQDDVVNVPENDGNVVTPSEESMASEDSQAAVSDYVLKDDEAIFGDFVYRVYAYDENDDPRVFIEKYIGAGGEVTVPDTIEGYPVTFLAQGSFTECTVVTSVILPDTVVEIAREAFSGCTGLTSINIPEGVKKIYYYCFENCSALTDITLPSTLEELEEGAFDDCSSLTSIDIPDSVTSMDACVFHGCTNLTSLSLPAGITIIPREAFYGCTSLEEFVIPDNVTEIDDCAFGGCESLSGLTIPPTLTKFGWDPFVDCPNLTIYGSEGSEAEYYASENDIKFEVSGAVSSEVPKEEEDIDGITEEGIEFSRKLKFNGYEFLLGCDIDEFIEGTHSVVENADVLEAYKADPSAFSKTLKCYVEAEDGRKIRYEVLVMSNRRGEIELREFKIEDDAQWPALEDPNLVTCGLEFLDGYDIKGTKMQDYDPKYSVVTEVTRGKTYTTMELNLHDVTKDADWWSISVQGTTVDESLDDVTAVYVHVSSVHW